MLVWSRMYEGARFEYNEVLSEALVFFVSVYLLSTVQAASECPCALESDVLKQTQNETFVVWLFSENSRRDGCAHSHQAS